MAPKVLCHNIDVLKKETHTHILIKHCKISIWKTNSNRCLEGRTNSQMVGGKRLIVRNTCALILTSNNQRTYGIDYSPSNTGNGTIETNRERYNRNWATETSKLAKNTAIKYWILPEFYDLNFNSMLFLCFFVATLLFAFYSWSQRPLDYTCFGYVWNIYMRFGFPRLVCWPVVKRTGLSKRQQPVEKYALEILRKHTKHRAR